MTTHVDQGSAVKPQALLLPALSSIATREEMQPLAARLAARFDPIIADWPGFGAPRPTGEPLSPAVLHAHVDAVLANLAAEPLVGVAAGHAATYLAMAALCHPGRFRRLILVAPTWRGPLPTMTGGRRPALCRRLRAALEAPVLGPALFRLNMSAPVIGWMMREHVYADPARVTPALVAAKSAVARRPGARWGTAAFVTGGLDPVDSRAAFLALFAGDLPPVTMLRPRGAPPRSGAEMDALAATALVTTVTVDGALAAHEEEPDAVARLVMDAVAPP